MEKLYMNARSNASLVFFYNLFTLIRLITLLADVNFDFHVNIIAGIFTMASA